MTPRIRLITLLLLAIAIGCLSPIAIAVPASENAALRYWRAWAFIGEEQMNLITTYDGDYNPEFNHAYEEDDPAFSSAELLERNAEAIELLIEAADFTECDFGVDYHKGVEALQPHLSSIRRSVQLLELDAKRLISEGDIDGATRRAVAAIQLSQHATGDTTLINSLVSMACFALMDNFVQANAAAFDAEHRRDIANALTRFDTNDPFGCARAVRGEAQFFGGWILRRIDNEWATPEGFAADYLLLFGESIEDAALQSMIAKTEYEGSTFRDTLRRDIDLYTTALHLVADAWNRPDADKSLKAIEIQVAQGSFGFIAQQMVPGFESCHSNDMRARALLGDLIEWSGR